MDEDAVRDMGLDPAHVQETLHQDLLCLEGFRNSESAGTMEAIQVGVMCCERGPVRS